ncbi:MAG: hypothetical protein WEF50_11215 [Myxococcota bacterium]
MLAALLLAPRISAAVPLYCIAFGVGSIDCTPESAVFVDSRNVPGGAQGTATGVRGTAWASAGTYYPVSLGVRAVAMDTTGLGASATARAEFSGYEVVISGPTGETTTTSLNLHLTGSISIPLGGGGGGDGEGVLSVATTLAGSQGTASGDGLFIRGISGGGGPLTFYSGAEGILEGLFFGGDFETPTLSVIAGETVFLSVSLEARARCLDSFGSFCSSSTNYFDFGLGLTTGPVFNLPEGWTANAPDGSIVANHFSTVPESSTWALLALPIFGTVVGRRRAD